MTDEAEVTEVETPVAEKSVEPETITAPEPTAEAANYSAGPEDGIDDPDEPLTEEDQDEEIDE